MLNRKRNCCYVYFKRDIIQDECVVVVICRVPFSFVPSLLQSTNIRWTPCPPSIPQLYNFVYIRLTFLHREKHCPRCNNFKHNQSKWLRSHSVLDYGSKNSLYYKFQNTFHWKRKVSDSQTVQIIRLYIYFVKGPSWSWSYGSWIYNYLCYQCLSPLMLWVRILLRRDVLDTILCDIVYQWLATGRMFSRDTPISSTNKTDRHDITEILLKVAVNTITLTLFCQRVMELWKARIIKNNGSELVILLTVSILFCQNLTCHGPNLV